MVNHRWYGFSDRCVLAVLPAPPDVAMSVSHDRPSNLLLHQGVDAPPALVTQLKESLEKIGNKYGSNKWKNVLTRHSDTLLIDYKKGMGMGHGFDGFV